MSGVLLLSRKAWAACVTAGSCLLANFPFAEVGKGTVQQFMQVLIGGIQPPGRLLWCVDRRELWQVLPLPSQLTLGLAALESAALVVVLVSVLIVVPPSTPTTTTAPLRKYLKTSRPGVTRTHDQGIMRTKLQSAKDVEKKVFFDIFSA